MVQKSPTAALDIFNIPLMALTPELAMSSTHDLGLEANRCGGRCARGYLWSTLTLTVSPNLDDCAFIRKRTRDGRER